MNEFYLRVMRIMEDNEPHLGWRCGDEGTPIRFWITCNDSFWWGSADAEEITEENVGILEQSIKDCDDPLLFCARVRKMRPQGAMYKYINTEHRHFFDACGPERELGFGNPRAPEEYWMETRTRETEEIRKLKEKEQCQTKKSSILSSISSAFTKMKKVGR